MDRAEPAVDPDALREPVIRKPSKPKRRPSRSRRWQLDARLMRRLLARVPRAIWIGCGVALLFPLFALTNLAYHVVRKPTELFAVIGHRLDKEPPATWRAYGPLFREYSTPAITPELLAALAQVESSGDPVDRTYWRWRWSFDPFAIYQPASSAVGLYQMIDGAFTEAARFCIRDHAITDSGCGFTGLYIRVIPSHAIELASIYLDRNVSEVLARVPGTKPSASEKQDLAAFIHLCGAGPATRFARRKFQMLPGERCGDHLVAAYVGRVDAFKRQFTKLTAADGD